MRLEIQDVSVPLSKAGRGMSWDVRNSLGWESDGFYPWKNVDVTPNIPEKNAENYNKWGFNHLIYSVL